MLAMVVIDEDIGIDKLNYARDIAGWDHTSTEEVHWLPQKTSAISITSSAGTHPHSISLGKVGDAILIQLTPHKSLTFLDYAIPLSPSSVLSLIAEACRRTGSVDALTITPVFCDLLHVHSLQTLQMLEETLMRLSDTRDLHASPGAPTPPSLEVPFFQIRSALLRYLFKMQAGNFIGLHESKAIRDTISSIDALSMASYNAQLYLLNRQLEYANYQDKILSENEQKNQSRLAKAAGALVFPTIWFGFLGSNSLPETIFGIPLDSATALALTILGAALSSLVGILAMAALTTPMWGRESDFQGS